MEKENSSLNQKQEPTDPKPKIEKDKSSSSNQKQEPTNFHTIYPRNIDFIPIIDQPLFVPQYRPYSYYRPSRIFIIEQFSVPDHLRFNYLRK